MRWATIEGAPGDIKDVIAKDLETAKAFNPGWEHLSDYYMTAYGKNANGCVVAAAVDGIAESRKPGARVGEESILLNINHIPPHTHTLKIKSYAREGGGANDRMGDGGSRQTYSAEFKTESSGGGQAVSIMQPTIYAWKLIKLPHLIDKP